MVNDCGMQVAKRVRFPGDYDALRKDERADFRQSRYCKASCSLGLLCAVPV